MPLPPSLLGCFTPLAFAKTTGVRSGCFTFPEPWHLQGCITYDDGIFVNHTQLRLRELRCSVAIQCFCYRHYWIASRLWRSQRRLELGRVASHSQDLGICKDASLTMTVFSSTTPNFVFASCAAAWRSSAFVTVITGLLHAFGVRKDDWVESRVASHSQDLAICKDASLTMTVFSSTTPNFVFASCAAAWRSSAFVTVITGLLHAFGVCKDDWVESRVASHSQDLAICKDTSLYDDGIFVIHTQLRLRELRSSVVI